TRPSESDAGEIVKKYVRWGAGPRAGQALILGAKAHALLAGRFAVAPTDILRVARPVLRHRILPNFAAEAKAISAGQDIDRLPEDRSEERRVGKECRCRWWTDDEEKKGRWDGCQVVEDRENTRCECPGR